MATAISDDGDTIDPAQVTSTLKQARNLLQSIATTGWEAVDEHVLHAEGAIREALRLLAQNRPST